MSQTLSFNKLNEGRRRERDSQSTRNLNFRWEVPSQLKTKVRGTRIFPAPTEFDFKLGDDDHTKVSVPLRDKTLA